MQLPRRLRTVRRLRLNSSPGREVNSFDARKILSLGSNREKTPSVTRGTRVNVARGRIVALERAVNPRDLSLTSQ